MTEYLSENVSFVKSETRSSPADIPFENPTFLRSKRSSRATTGSSREASSSPPPSIPSDAWDTRDRGRDAAFGSVDPRRFTPTLHASLVSEILTLRRDLDSKNHLVENLEASLSRARAENDEITEHVAQHARDARKAKLQVQQLEKGTDSAVDTLAKERDLALGAVDELKLKLDAMSKKTRTQEEDAVRTQGMWENEKESWENERRQFERRIHVTENRLRTIVDEMTSQQQQQQQLQQAQQAQQEAASASVSPAAASAGQLSPVTDAGEGSTFKDSALGHESDTASIRSTPRRHRRNISDSSNKSRGVRFSALSGRSLTSPVPEPLAPGFSLADELGSGDDDDFDEDLEDDLESVDARRRILVESRMSFHSGEVDAKAKRILGLTHESTPPSQSLELHRRSVASPVPLEYPPPRPEYVHRGYQPSPPSSPGEASIPTIREPVVAIEDEKTETAATTRPVQTDEVRRQAASSPISPPETPVVHAGEWVDEAPAIDLPQAKNYASASTQTETAIVEKRQSLGVSPSPPRTTGGRQTLSAPLVPSIAIRPATPQPSSPRPYVLPPGTKNASTQANVQWNCRDASMQTEEIRIDKRSLAKASDLLKRRSSRLLPSPNIDGISSAPTPQSLQITTQQKAPFAPLNTSLTSPTASGTPPVTTGKIKIPPIFTQTPVVSSPIESGPGELSRDNSSKDLKNLRAIPLPRPVLSPIEPVFDAKLGEGPLNRASQYGVTRPLQSANQLADIDRDTDMSDYDDPMSDREIREHAGSALAHGKPPQSRFGLSGPPKVVPEEKEISPERRPHTAGSYGMASVPTTLSGWPLSSRPRQRSSAKFETHKSSHSRSPSYGSLASSNFSMQSMVQPSSLPPYPIPQRSSSRVKHDILSDESRSPSTTTARRDSDAYEHRHSKRRSHHGPDANDPHAGLRKVQSAAAIRNGQAQASPTRPRRRRRSPDLTPVQSMAFDPGDEDDDGRAAFPVPELPTPLQDGLGSFDFTTPGTFDSGPTPIEPVTRPSTIITNESRPSHENNLVDAIAATMVGEWMWKYIRKRKSFGIGEDADLTVQAQSAAAGMNMHGTRHKRWVWLSPYERTIMWDSKQPSSGSALLGKKGRKLTIDHVLDIQDDTPIPSKNPDLETAYKRSILILTPARALKFTAVTKERHQLWLTALSFLAQSGRLPAPLPHVTNATTAVVSSSSKATAAGTSTSRPSRPPIPSQEPPTVKRSRSPAVGRSTIRDSVRVAKGRRPSEGASIENRHSIGLASAQTTTATATTTTPSGERDTTLTAFPAADFPAVPRLYSGTHRHDRKRSNTSPRPSASSLSGFRSLSSGVAVLSPSASSSRLGPGSTTTDPQPSLSSHSGIGGGFGHLEYVNPSDNHHHLHHQQQQQQQQQQQANFFEAVGTIRMEAFVDPTYHAGVRYVPGPPPLRHRRGESNLSSSSDRRRVGHIFDDDADLLGDPFGGF